MYFDLADIKSRRFQPVVPYQKREIALYQKAQAAHKKPGRPKPPRVLYTTYGAMTVGYCALLRLVRSANGYITRGVYCRSFVLSQRALLCVAIRRYSSICRNIVSCRRGCR